MNREAVERVVETAASRITYTGSAGTMLGLVTSSQFIAIVGLLLALGGFLVNWHYKHKHFQMRQREHQRWLDKLRTTGPAPLDQDE